MKDLLGKKRKASDGACRITAALAVDGAIVRGTTFDLRAAEELRAEGTRQVKRKVDQDSSAMNGLVTVA